MYRDEEHYIRTAILCIIEVKEYYGYQFKLNSVYLWIYHDIGLQRKTKDNRYNIF